MDEPLLTIGAFARAVGLAPGTLRYYDECGLLRPAEVDEATGYRYYTPDLARRAQAVARMRDAGVPVEVMRTALDGPPEERDRALRAVLEEQEEVAARRAALLEELLAEPFTARTGSEVEVDGGELAAAVRQVRAAADTDPASPLAGVLLDVAAGTVDVVATNRYWMAVRTLAAYPADDVRVVLPLPSAARLAGLLEAQDRAVVEVRDADDTPSVVVSGERVEARAVAYPAHRMLLAGLPQATSRVVVPRVELAEAVAAVGHAEVDLEVTPDGVDVEGRLVRATVDRPGTRLRVGAALTRRALGAALGEEVVLRPAAPTQAVRLTSPYQPGFLALLMPVAPDA